jgi:hypothetical protein
MWLMLVSSVRYAMGRATYIVSDTTRLVLAYERILTDDQLRKIRDEVKAELRLRENMGGTLGMEMDHREWQRFVVTLDERLAART